MRQTRLGIPRVVVLEKNDLFRDSKSIRIWLIARLDLTRLDWDWDWDCCCCCCWLRTSLLLAKRRFKIGKVCASNSALGSGWDGWHLIVSSSFTVPLILVQSLPLFFSSLILVAVVVVKSFSFVCRQLIL
jgi:hypothetical protein